MRRRHAPRGVHWSKGTDAAKARTGKPDSTLGPDLIRCASAHRTAPALRCGKLRRACSPNGIAPRMVRPGNRFGTFGERWRDAGATLWSKTGCWRHRLGGGADQPTPVQSRTPQNVGLGRPKQWQEWRPPLGAWRTRSNARLAGNGRWERANGIGRGSAETQASVWDNACLLTCTPGTRRRMWTLWMKHGSRSLTSLAMYGGGTAAGLRVGRRSRLRQTPRCQRMLLRQDSPACVGVTNHLWMFVLRHAPTEVGDDNGRRATTAAMRNGYRRGECFEGYEPRCGERCRTARPVGAGTFGFTKQTARGWHRETQRTLSGSGCNMPEPPERSKPSRW
jgi:hypothetical protein